MNEINLQLLTPRETAKALGVRPNTLAIWRSKRRYKLRYIKLGGKIRYRLADIQKFLESRTVEPEVRR